MKPGTALPPLHRAAPLALLAGLLALPGTASPGADEFDAPSPEQVCEATVPQHRRLPAGRHLAAIPREARPAKGRPHRDLVHGSCILRVTDHAREAPRGFARRPAFNADESRLLVADREGAWHLYDARTLEHRGTLPAIGADADPQWHPLQPQRLHYLPQRGTAMQLLELDLPSGRTRVAADFATRVKRLWPTARAVRAPGAPSADGRYRVLLADDGAQGSLGLFTWDLQEDRLVASLDLASLGRGRPEFLAMSPSGRHVVASWPDGALAFTRELAGPRRLPGGGAPDLALTADGDDAYVTVDPQAEGAPLVMVRLRDGERTELFRTRARGAAALQVSGRAHGRPGWVLVSTSAEQGPGGRQWLHRRLMAVELRPSPRIVHLAFHHDRSGRPGSAPPASVSRDFTRVLFSSNWGAAGDADADADADTYMVVLSREALTR